MEPRIELSYPTRCLPPTHGADTLPAEGEKVRIHGRLICCGEGEGILSAEWGQVPCRWEAPVVVRHSGEIVELEGWMGKVGVQVSALRVLAPVRQLKEQAGWEVRERVNAAKRANLLVRARVLQAIRSFFSAARFLEVETPVLVHTPGQEAHLLLFETTFIGQTSLPCCLVSSPEHHMKRLLGAGCERLFQLSRSFRNGELSELHNPEFTMLEWYRAYASYEEVMVDVEQLVASVCLAVKGTTRIEYQGQLLDLTPPWERLTVQEAFGRFAGVDLKLCSSREEFYLQARDHCPSVDTRDTWEEIFFKVFLEKVEPAMAADRPVLLKDYPASMAALAKVVDGEQVAERVEAYVGGVELANGFTELNDPLEQRRRFMVERDKRAARGYPLHPLDEEFLQMLEMGMPPAGGMALGVDRLVMLLADAPRIDEIIAFPFAAVEGCL